MATRYRVYIGEASPAHVIEHALTLGACTVTEGTGVWNGARERTTIVEILNTCTFAEVSGERCECDIQGRVKAFAALACRVFAQDCVLVTSEPVNAELISAPVPVAA